MANPFASLSGSKYVFEKNSDVTNASDRFKITSSGFSQMHSTPPIQSSLFGAPGTSSAFHSSTKGKGHAYISPNRNVFGESSATVFASKKKSSSASSSESDMFSRGGSSTPLRSAFGGSRNPAKSKQSTAFQQSSGQGRASKLDRSLEPRQTTSYMSPFKIRRGFANQGKVARVFQNAPENELTKRPHSRKESNSEIVFFGSRKVSKIPAAKEDLALTSMIGVNRISPTKKASADINKRTALIVREIPSNCNERDKIQRHFMQFGKIMKLVHYHDRKSAAVHFESHEMAERAKVNGKVMYRGAPAMSIFWSHSGDNKKKVVVIGKSGKDEVKKSLNAPVAPMSRKSTNSSRAKATLGTSAAKGRPKKQLNIQSGPTDVSTPVSKAKAVPEPEVKLDSLVNNVALSVSERCDILRLRDKAIRYQLKQTQKMTLVMRGSCPDMCPELERYLRQDRRRLSPYEAIPGTERVDHMKAVKEYSRSSADQEMPLPHELRPLPVLEVCMNYLLSDIADSLEQSSVAEWFDFLWNRMRGLRKEITQQQLCNQRTAALVEKCVRFHIFCAHRLCEEDMMTFDPKINNENLTKCLQTLKELYHDLGNRQIFCDNEAEFRAYIILMNMNEGNVLRDVQNLRSEVRLSAPVQNALKLYRCLNLNNYKRFFQLVEEASFFVACILHRYFYQVRSRAFQLISQASHKGSPYTVDYLVKILAFEDETEAIEFSCHHGLVESGGSITFQKTTSYVPHEMVSLQRAVRVIEGKTTKTTGELINGKPLGKVELPPAQDSFDERGAFMILNGLLDQNLQCPPTPLSKSESELRQSFSHPLAPKVTSSTTVAPPLHLNSFALPTASRASVSSQSWMSASGRPQMSQFGVATSVSFSRSVFDATSSASSQLKLLQSSSQCGVLTSVGAVPSSQFGTSVGAVPSSQFGTSVGAVPSSQFGTSVGAVPSSQFGTSVGVVPSSQFGTSVGAVPSSQFGALTSVGAVPSSQFGTKTSIWAVPSSQFGTTASVGTEPSSPFGTAASVGGLPSSQFGAPTSVAAVPSSQFGAPTSPTSFGAAPSSLFGGDSSHKSLFAVPTSPLFAAENSSRSRAGYMKDDSQPSNTEAEDAAGEVLFGKLTSEVCCEVCSEVCNEVVREVSEQTLLSLVKAEHDASELALSIISELVEEEIKTLSHKCFVAIASFSFYAELSNSVLSTLLEEVSQECLLDRERVKMVSCQNLVEQFLSADCDEFVRSICREFFQQEVLDRRLKFKAAEQSMSLRKLKRSFGCWRGVVKSRLKLKASMREFPPCPATISATEQLKTLVPLSQGVRGNHFHAGDNAWLSMLAADKVVEDSQDISLMLQMKVCLKDLKEQLTWSPLDVAALSGALRSASTAKIVIALPISSEEIAEEQMVIAEWLTEKFSLQRRLATDGLSQLLCSVSCGSRPWQFCARSVRQNLSDDELTQLEECGALLGSSGMVMALPEPVDVVNSDNFWLSQCLELTRLVQVLPANPPIPLVVIHIGTFSARQIEHELGLRTDILQQAFPKVYFITAPRIDFKVSQQLSDAVDWLFMNRPAEPKVHSAILPDFLEERLSCDFFCEVYQDSANRNAVGVLSAEPNMLISLFNATIDHAISIVCNTNLRKLSWPIPEFKQNLSDSVCVGWNSLRNLLLLERRLEKLKLPQVEWDNSHYWVEAVEDALLFAKEIAKPSLHRLSHLRASVKKITDRYRHNFSQQCLRKFGLTNCEPDACNLPWSDIVLACIDYKMQELRYAETEHDEIGGQTVVFWLNDIPEFHIPESWQPYLNTIGNSSLLDDSFSVSVKRKMNEERSKMCKKIHSDLDETRHDLNCGSLTVRQDQMSHLLDKTQLLLQDIGLVKKQSCFLESQKRKSLCTVSHQLRRKSGDADPVTSVDAKPFAEKKERKAAMSDLQLLNNLPVRRQSIAEMLDELTQSIEQEKNVLRMQEIQLLPLMETFNSHGNDSQ